MSSSPVPLFSMLGSPMQMLVIGLIILILFGASRLGDVGKGLGEGIRNFKKGISGDDDEGDSKAPKRIASQRSETGAASGDTSEIPKTKEDERAG